LISFSFIPGAFAFAITPPPPPPSFLKASQSLASDVSVLAEDIAGLRTKLTHQDAEIAQLREGLFTRTEELAGTVEQSVASERREVQAVLDTVRSSMRKQNEQNQQVLSSLHSSQQRLASQISDVDDRQSQKTREVEVRPDILGNSTTSTNIFTHSTVRLLSPLSLPFSFRVRVVLCCVVLCCVILFWFFTFQIQLLRPLSIFTTTLQRTISKVDSSLKMKSEEMTRGLEDSINALKRHLDANDQAVRLVTDMINPITRGAA